MSPSWRTSSSGVGSSATWVSRMIAISAAIIAFGAVAASSSALSSICQARDSTRIDSRSAKSRPRARSSGPTVGSSAASGASRTIVTQCVTSARSRSTAIGSAPAAYCAASSANAACASPDITASKRSSTRPRSASPSIARTSAAVAVPAPCAIAWSSSDCASRTEPSAARVISASASGATAAPSRAASAARWPSIASGSIRRRSKRWQRDSTVTGTLRISVVAKMNLTCAGGSSSVFRSALNAEVLSMCTSSMM